MIQGRASNLAQGDPGRRARGYPTARLLRLQVKFPSPDGRRADWTVPRA